jgi:ketosteroid isomerase-like protein
MSQENVERTRRAFEAIARGDFAFVQELMAPEVVIVQPPEVPDAKTYEGRDAVMRSWEDWPMQWDDFRMELLDVIDVDDDTVISVTRQRGRGRDSGIEMEFDVYFVGHARDGLTTRMEMFFNREQALDAAGATSG